MTDLDGTLWDAQDAVHEATRRALDELHRRGVAVVVATGRRRRSALRSLERVGLSTLPAVLLDGALGCHSLAEAPIFQVPFSDSEAAAVAGVFADFGCEPVFETDDLDHDRLCGLTSGPYHHLLTDTTTLACDPSAPLPVPALGALTVTQTGVAPALVDALNTTTAGHAWRAFYPQEAPGSVVVRVRPAVCSKWTGICQWLEHHNIGLDAVLAVGDNDNDLEMLQHAALSLAVESGSSAAIATAQYLIGAPQQGGWASVLDYL